MIKPKLLLRIDDSGTENRLVTSVASKRFEVTRVQVSEPWLDILNEQGHELAIIQSGAVSEFEALSLANGGLPCSVNLIFLNDGIGADRIRQITKRVACYNLTLPLDMEFMEELIGEVEAEILRHRKSNNTQILCDLDQYGALLGSSGVMRHLYKTMHRAADTASSIFLVGESGTGKEVAAETIHMTSSRAEKPFVAINCGAISGELIGSELFGHKKGAFTGAVADRKGIFEEASEGTLFLDEVTEIPLEHQVKLLRVLESGTYRALGSDVLKTTKARIVAATNRDPSAAVKAGKFRQDLYYRLCQFPIRLPPLRDRGEDVVGLARYFLQRRNEHENTYVELHDEALELIRSYAWPGNVRELRHAIERAYILAHGTITAEHLLLGANRVESALVQSAISVGIPLEEAEKRIILMTLERHHGNKTESAQQLGISVKTLYNKLERYRAAQCS